MKLAIYVLCLLSTIVMGVFIIPLLWCVPMTMKAYRYYKGTETNLSTGFAVCTLLFVNVIAGILMLLDQ